MKKTKKLLRGMTDAPITQLPPWETEWLVLGPFSNAGSAHNWPGEHGFATLPLDAATEIPAAGNTPPGHRTAFSTNGRLDFCQIFPQQSGLPIVFIMTEFDAEADSRVPISFGACWGTQWWLNGALVYETRRGNGDAPDWVGGNQFYAPVRSGRNTFNIKIIAGTSDHWSITMSMLPPQPFIEPAARQPTPPPALSISGSSSRDYASCGLRIEHRPGPVSAEIAAMREKTIAEHGVEAHWIGIVAGGNEIGVPYAPSKYLPGGSCTETKNAAKIKTQVSEIHANGMAAMTWYPGIYSRSAAEAHPEWRARQFPAQESDGAVLHAMQTAGENQYALCINSPYGRALISFVLESLQHYELDGFWFDGTKLSGDGALSCICTHCGERFYKDEGLQLPQRPDWSDPAFRRWIIWRYDNYMDFWGKLNAEVQRQFPYVRIVVNHLHRLPHSWYSGVPLNPYNAGIIAGTESQDDPFITAFHGRLLRAYRQPQSEIWMGLHKLFTRNENWPPEMDPIYRYVHHGLSAMTTGLMPSFGTPDAAEELVSAYDFLGRLINPRQLLTGGRSLPYAGLLISQQAETFHFSRRTDWAFPESYWHNILGWHHLLMENQCLLDLIFDADIDTQTMFEYPVIIAPAAVAISAKQRRRLKSYVNNGGTLIIDRWFGSCDQWGQSSAKPEPFCGHQPVQAPDPDLDMTDATGSFQVQDAGAGKLVIFDGTPGLVFQQNRSRKLSVEIALLVKQLAPPQLEINGPARLHVGMYRQPGAFVLHLQNFIAYSCSEAFPNPILAAPEPIATVHVRLRNMPIRAVTLPLRDNCRQSFTSQDDAVEFSLQGIQWGEIVRLEY